MAQNITLTLAGRVFPLVAEDADRERAMRIAAEQINAKLGAFDARYPDKPFADKLLLVALGESVSKILLQNQAKSVSEEVKGLESQIDSYLKTV